ncbi:selection and upkeep of intraepithelial T-cells protein 4-like [Sinocyclocheilus rhinocerous]|uniref:selection and upkeep of intraepithelial T-cells protein 4-like n=1 Tax=Sinocyclocheilus rhinocerous TaxID=307959 RepID=UPI0007B7A9D5|nr:PREDICTED: selection and upkeep of intraepithelial T-cells protein 4-like [Sinocyclocheilus rhinocerous]
MLTADTDEEDMKKPVCSLLALVVTTLLLAAASGVSDAAMNITAVLGHSVTFRCPSNHSRPVERLYIQRVIKDKEDMYINGFTNGREMPGKGYQSRTKVNAMDYSMEMRNISVGDEGSYICVFVFVDKAYKPEISEIILKVTAEYSVPTITPDCSEHRRGVSGTGMSCHLSCSAVGGYPQSTVRWAGLNPSLTNVFYNWSLAHNDSKTWTINQTIMYNCDQPANVSCAVGGAVSHTITICQTESFPLRVIAAIAFVVVFVLLLIFVVVMKCYFGRPPTSEDRVEGADVPLADCHSQLQSV